MDWLQSLDVALFRFVNHSLSNPFFDWLMPVLSKNAVFFPLVGLVAAWMIWKFRARGVLCAAFLAAVVLLGDPLVVNTLKDFVQRPRPFNAIPDAHLLVGKGSSYSMPSGHAANWFAAATIAFLYFRRSAWVMLPLAALVALSRVYNGVHYPSDVLVGALLGVTYAAGGLWLADFVWRKVGENWFPLWWQKFPSLRHPEKSGGGDATLRMPQDKLNHLVERQWTRLAYATIGLLLGLRLFYIGCGAIELSEDEAYQWVWSKHPALSYYSKPPMIAYTQWVGTHLWGDNEFGVRFFSPVIAALISLLMLRFLNPQVGARTTFFFLLILTTTPLTSVGATLMTIDPLNVLFWVAAMLAGWQAVERNSTKYWAWTGLWMGLGFLSKYTTLFQLLCWAIFFVLWKPARAQLRRPGPYLALLLLALCTLPVLIWNAQNGWITVTHTAERGGMNRRFQFSLVDFVVQELVVLNPIFCIAMVWACIAVWRRHRQNKLLLYLFCMGVPVILFNLLLSLRSKVQPNWIAPAVVPLFALMALYWHGRWREGVRAAKVWLIVGATLGLVAVVFMHETKWIEKLTGYELPADKDPLRRVRGWKETAQAVGKAREKLLNEGKPVFVIGDHYGITGQLSFYLPEGKAGVPNDPLVYCQSSERPDNQFYFWPGYSGRKGQNALYIRDSKNPRPAPDRLMKEFRSVTDLGMIEIKQRNRVLRTLQIFECRDLQ